MKTTETTQRKIVNYLNYDYTQDEGILNTLPSETVPNQAFSVNEVLLRFSQGTLPHIVQPVYYDDTDDFDNIDPTLNPAFDFVDADNILEEIKLNKKEREEIIQNSPQQKDKSERQTKNNNDELNDDEKIV